jgi:putative addiction module antidote
MANALILEKCMKVKLQRVGNSIVTSFPKEVLDRLGLVEGDTMNLVVTDDGIKLVIHDPNFDKVMAAYKLGASQYRNAMGELADG